MYVVYAKSNCDNVTHFYCFNRNISWFHVGDQILPDEERERKRGRMKEQLNRTFQNPFYRAIESEFKAHDIKYV